MTKKVLISENRQIAQKHIETLKAQAKGLNELMKVFNDLPVLRPIQTKGQVQDFLKDPTNFLDSAVLRDSDTKFGKVRPVPEELARLFGIPRDKFLQQLSRTRIADLENLKFNEKTLTIEFNPEKEAGIFEEFKEYARSEEEAKEILKIRELCKSLNDHCYRFNMLPSDMNTAAQVLGLRCDVKPDGRGWEFREHMTILREKLNYKAIHSES